MKQANVQIKLRVMLYIAKRKFISQSQCTSFLHYIIARSILIFLEIMYIIWINGAASFIFHLKKYI